MQSISVFSCGPCCISSSHDGRNIVMGGPDGVLKIGSAFVCDDFSDCCFQEEPITSVTLDSMGMFGAIACKESRKVLLISMDDYAVAKVLHRPRLFANDLCFSPNGQYVAIASAENEVQVAAVGDSTPTITLRQNGTGAIKSVSFDNNGTILATVSGSGYLELWKPFDGAESVACIHSAKISDNDPRETSPLLLRCCWTKSNNLVTPYFKDVRILDKDFKLKTTLSGQHRDNVSQVVLGADGDLVASLSVDGVCCLWNIKTETLATYISDVPKGSIMTWPSGSADIVFVDRNGCLKIWKNAAKTPVSPDATASSRAEASSAVKTVVKHKTSGKSSLVDLEAEVSGSASEDEKSGSDDVGDDDMKDFIDADESPDSPKQKQGATKRKQSKRRLHSNVGLSDSDDVDDDFAPDAYPVFESKMQDPVQPCNCSSDGGIHSFFGYNHKAAVYGTLSGREEYNAETDVVIEFHDKVKNRPIRFKTPHNVVRGCLGEAGVLLAVNDPACIIFRGIPDQGRDSKWEISLQSTSVALAVGDSWSAVACADRTLRIITSSGLVSALFCIPGDVVMLTARNSTLAVAYHAGEATLAGNQSIVVAVYDVFKRRQITVFPLALSALAQLMWMAFNDSGTLFTFDSAGVFRVVSQDFGCAQVPMKLEAGEKRVWPVDLEDEEIFYIALRPDQSCPTTDTQARPYLKTSPLVTEETQQASKQSSAKQEQQIRSFADIEGKLIRGLALSRGVDTESDAYLRSTYGPMLKMMEACIKDDRSQRVKEIARLLKPSKMQVMAVKLANREHRTILAEQLQEIFDQMQDAAESSDGENDDEPQYRRNVTVARRQQQDERKAASDQSEHEDSTPESDNDHHDEAIQAPVVQPKAVIPSAAPSASDALSKKSLGVNPFKKRAIEAQALAAKPADLMAILNGRSNPATAASSKAAPVAKGKASKASGKV